MISLPSSWFADLDFQQLIISRLLCWTDMTNEHFFEAFLENVNGYYYYYFYFFYKKNINKN